MKELSIEEKAKRYDEAIEIAKKINNEQQAQPFNVMTVVFPELKESEDERMIKSMTRLVKAFYDCNFPTPEGFERKDMLAWLEKQCKNNICISETTKQKLEDELNKALEKETPESWNKFLEKQCEKKPDDKVEPKFHEDDWIIQGCNILKIRCVGDEYYCFETVGGYVDDMLVSEIDSLYHLWTIQDAKVGDVLADDYGIYIFDKFDKYDKRCFLCIGAYQYSQKVYEDEHMLCSINVRPATKEQREQLEKAMADAGYTFDFEKKELKKIEQKPAWSEEDDIMLDKCIEAACSNYYQGISSVRDWLRGIKNRVLPQPKQEWSEEDNIILSRIIADYERSNEEWFNAQKSLPHGRKITWLKSLRPQNRWKPSDEQMKALWEVYKGGEEQATLASLWSDLKKLKSE